MTYEFENKTINSSVRTKELFEIEKMEDVYLRVEFRYPTVVWNGAVPLVAKYQGVNIPFTIEDVFVWVEKCYEIVSPDKAEEWTYTQKQFWENKNAVQTGLVFNALNGSDKTTQWLCRNCSSVSEVNSQPASRIRKLKQDGYHVATIKMDCSSCGKKTYHDLLIRLPRFAANNQKRSIISEALRARILNILPNNDCLTGEYLDKKACVIDHKFPSSRWVQGESVNETNMPEEKIKEKFQILSNQSNLHKERYCQKCVIDGQRGDFFGIQWYYEGNSEWQGSSKADENGCIGCPWYDIDKWKKEFNACLEQASIEAISF